MCVLVTGGAGYIGSHICVELLNAGYEVVVVDNLINSKSQSIKRVAEITGKKIKFYRIDLLDENALDNLFYKNDIKHVIHLAGLKSVKESVDKPIIYFRNNIIGSINLLGIMEKHKVYNLVYSSSAVVYGNPKQIPISEKSPLMAKNPYARTKLIVENLLKDINSSNKKWSIAILRYFNPIGAHESGLIGEDPYGVPNNLLPHITQVTIGKLNQLKVFGNDYPTLDGTGIRDYIHVVDLAEGHLKALNKIIPTTGVYIYNLGTGKGYSVLEIINTFEKVTGQSIPYQIVGRRGGDIPKSFTDTRKAEIELKWKAKKELAEMCNDAWRWQLKNPNGYICREVLIR